MKFIIATAIILLSLSFLRAEEKVGSIVLVGGGTVPPESILWMKSKCQSDKFAVVTLHKDRCQRWKDFFGSPIIYFPEELEELNGIGGIVIDGGDQFCYFKRLNPKIIEKAHKKGICILGTSAGAMIISEHFFSASEGTISSEEALAGQRICLGNNFISIDFLKNTIIDTHYIERNRQGRLRIFMEKSGASKGIGIDEATALCIDENGNHFIFGEGKAHVLTTEIKLAMP